jgi:hypothetical protein
MGFVSPLWVEKLEQFVSRGNVARKNYLTWSCKPPDPVTQASVLVMMAILPEPTHYMYASSSWKYLHYSTSRYYLAVLVEYYQSSTTYS